jgi:GDP-mannose 6-dehydrogenase
MKVSVFGLGYVGSVSAASLAADGHAVVGVDADEQRVAAINAGRSPSAEPGLDAIVAGAVNSGRLRATMDTAEAIHESEVSLLCYGTPGREDGSLDLEALERVSGEIGRALRQKAAYHVVVVRSTVLPGTTHEIVIPALERESGKKYGTGFGVSVNPEFLREGTAVKDFRKPPLTLVGHNHSADASGTIALYQAIDAPLVSTSIRVAEMIKYVSNAWHALKIAFANEIGVLCKGMDLDSHAVMDIFCRDEKLNLSPSYLRPGFAFGGCCLPRDLRALEHRARAGNIEVPLLSHILPSNALHIQHAVDAVLATGRQRIGLLGFSFKPGIDDVRESPMVVLAHALVERGLSLRIYDPHVSLERLTGTNRDYIDRQVPDLASMLRGSCDDVIAESDVIVAGAPLPEFVEAVQRCRSDQIVIDLVRLPVSGPMLAAEYRGICW